MDVSSYTDKDLPKTEKGITVLEAAPIAEDTPVTQLEDLIDERCGDYEHSEEDVDKLVYERCQTAVKIAFFSDSYCQQEQDAFCDKYRSGSLPPSFKDLPEKVRNPLIEKGVDEKKYKNFLDESSLVSAVAPKVEPVEEEPSVPSKTPAEKSAKVAKEKKGRGFEYVLTCDFGYLYPFKDRVTKYVLHKSEGDQNSKISGGFQAAVNFEILPVKDNDFLVAFEVAYSQLVTTASKVETDQGMESINPADIITAFFAFKIGARWFFEHGTWGFAVGGFAGITRTSDEIDNGEYGVYTETEKGGWFSATYPSYGVIAEASVGAIITESLGLELRLKYWHDFGYAKLSSYDISYDIDKKLVFNDNRFGETNALIIALGLLYTNAY